MGDLILEMRQRNRNFAHNIVRAHAIFMVYVNLQESSGNSTNQVKQCTKIKC